MPIPQIMKLKIHQLLLLALLCCSGMTQAQIVFADPDFKAFLLSSSTSNAMAFTADSEFESVAIDANNDGEIQESEALLITRLMLSSLPSSITDVGGIEHFTNLQYIEINGGSFPTFDASTLVNLRTIYITMSSIVSMDISMLTQLETFATGMVYSLESLTIGSLPNLKVLVLPSCSLTTLDLSGVPNLTQLDVSNNPLAHPLVVSHLTDLVDLNCRSTSQTALNLLPCVNLQKLNCGYNPLGALNVSTLTNLKELTCTSNGLTDLDVSMLTQLEVLYIDSNPISSINLAPLAGSLRELHCFLTLLPALDLSAFSHLERLSCGNTTSAVFASLMAPDSLKDLSVYGYTQPQLNISLPLLERLTVAITTSLQEIDFSGSPLINNLSVSNNASLTYVNTKNGNPQIPMYWIDYNPLLQMICANEGMETTWYGITTPMFENNPNLVVNSYCSFTPGGLYNTISGTIRFDNGNDGCDANEPVFSNTKVTINDGFQSGAAFTSPTGTYTFFTQAGDFTLTPEIENPSYFNISATPATVHFDAANSLNTTVDFCVTPVGIHPEAEITIVPIGQARPGFDAHYKLIYKNTGNQTLSGWASVTFDDARTDFVSASSGVTQTGNTLALGYVALAPFQTRSVDFSINLNSPMETPALNQDDILDFYAVLHYTDAHANVGNLSEALHQVVVNSLDPNDKTCLEGNTISPDMIGDYVHYNINFENIGTAEAINIVVKDEIDAAKFDISTLQVMYASHPVTTRIVGHRVDFIFENINLPGTSGDNKGNVVFKIKTKPTLVLGNTISNKAEIFFDYNFPIETNEAASTFSVLKTDDFQTDASIAIAPNPSKGTFNVKTDSNIEYLQLFDLQGRILLSSNENSNEISIDLSNRPNGVYFLKIITQKGGKIEKLVKQ
ncbi:T9SS type A sorting domain-containing protein [Flavobacterium sp.]|uniref:T9SS type A sorting domain-containing protein n=1 Tax=Flavobacterium sp. TaxID=239 RepID=UPI0039E50774